MKRMIQGLRVLIVIGVAALLFVSGLLFLHKMLYGENTLQFFGYAQARVSSMEMQPALSEGDLVVAKAKDSYKMGDVVIFYHSNTVRVNRIVGRHAEDFITRGDANAVEDADLLEAKDIIGEVKVSIPKMGDLMDFLSSPIGLVALAVTGVVFLLLPAFAFQTEKKRKELPTHRGQRFR